MLWKRPAGPPHVWRVIELVDSSGENRKFSLQEIPEERYQEAITHMCTIYARDETLCRARDLINDPQSMEVMRKLWSEVLLEGISVAAYDISKENIEPKLAGLNLLVYADENYDKLMKSQELESLSGGLGRYLEAISAPVDPRRIYKVDRYLSAFGLSVSPDYRRLGLGQQLLEIRDDIGKTYGIEYTSTLFTSEASQSLAEKAGFKTDSVCPYDDALKEDGTPILPTLKGKSCKIMSKRIA